MNMITYIKYEKITLRNDSAKWQAMSLMNLVKQR